MTESNTTMKWLLQNENITTKFQNTTIPKPFNVKICLVIFLTVIVLSDECESMWSTYGFVDSWKESGVQWSAVVSLVTQFVFYYDILILRDQLHVSVNVLVFTNLVDLTYLRNDLSFVTQCLLLYL